MIVHVVLDGVADGPLGVALDVVSVASRIVRAGMVRTSLSERALRQKVVSWDGQPVRSGTGRLVQVDGALHLGSLRADDVLVLPGLSNVTSATIQERLKDNDVTTIAARIARAHAKGVTVAASCAATFVLAHSGVLNDREATTTWWLVPAFLSMFSRVELHVDRMVVRDREVLTAGSAFAHADLMLAIVARVAGVSVAHLVSRYLVLDERPAQSRYMVMDHVRSVDPQLRAMEDYIRKHLSGNVRVEAMARAAGLSTRTLARRVREGLGMTPLECVHRMRMAHARQLLETTRDTVEHVALQVGYADAAAFRKVFRRYVGESPKRARGRRV